MFVTFFFSCNIHFLFTFISFQLLAFSLIINFMQLFTSPMIVIETINSICKRELTTFGFCFVQSSEYNPVYLQGRIDNFINNLEELLLRDISGCTQRFGGL
ncbi:hypothetical protein I3760_11G063000 [Carya illinoinensis]|nr:hypothetical protein I3760_11G063000 [Carya illinoinensis]